MSIFSSILQKIGIGKPAAPAAANPAADAAAKAKADAAVNAAMAKAAEEARARVAAAQAKPAAPAPVAQTPVAPTPAAAPMNMAPASMPAPVAPAVVHQAAVPVVDVLNKLEGLSKSHPGLDWKVSIVDLLKLLEIDSGFEARKELAVELGCPANLMNDSASMNIWLHKTVLQKIAENGGNIPASMLD